MKIATTDVVRGLFLVFLGYITYRIMQGNEPYILHSVDLIFHEAGHVIFGFFGDFIQFLGGTLGQLLIPIICGISFLRKKDWYAGLVMLWWFGANLVDVGKYMADARAQVLPLLGGEHDWFYLFATMNVLPKDTAIGGTTALLGEVCMIGAIVLALFLLYRKNGITNLER